MDLAIKKAKTVGVGWVCANNSNHYGNACIGGLLELQIQTNFSILSVLNFVGIAGWHSIYAEQQGLIGKFSFFLLVFPTVAISIVRSLRNRSLLPPF